MSWSVYGVGKAPAVRKSITQQAISQTCAEPEETVRKAAMALVDAALRANTHPDCAVRVMASGSQAEKYGPNAEHTGQFSNNLDIEVELLYGFAE